MELNISADFIVAEMYITSILKSNELNENIIRIPLINCKCLWNAIQYMIEFRVRTRPTMLDGLYAPLSRDHVYRPAKCWFIS